jgi:C_GCAxxG_C_C family probable redox protein
MAIDPSSDDRTNARAQRVKELLALSGNCAQTSYAVLQEEFNLDGKQILKALTPFPGIALRGETCGAVIGCLMAIGLVYGREDLSDWKGYLESLPPSRRFCRRFVEQHGTTACSSILQAKLGRSYNLADREESMQYVAAGGPKACEEVIARAVHIAAELLDRKV